MATEAKPEIPIMPYGNWVNLIEALTEALAGANTEQRPWYVYQASGQFCAFPYPMADEPHIQVAPGSQARILCDWCEGEKQARYEAKHKVEYLDDRRGQGSAPYKP